MNPDPDPGPEELLVRFLDNRTSEEESRRVNRWLRDDPAARARLRWMAEQAVAVADLERAASEQAGQSRPGTVVPFPRSPGRRSRIPAWTAIAAALVLLSVVAGVAVRSPARTIGQVRKVTGVTRHFGIRAPLDRATAVGDRIGVGDTLETRSCDGWIEIGLRQGVTLSLGGQGRLGILGPLRDADRLRLAAGYLSVAPDSAPDRHPLVIETPVATIELREAQATIGTTDQITLLRVHAGRARVTGIRDGTARDVAVGEVARIDLAGPVGPQVRSLPEPVDRWAWESAESTELLLGRHLPPVDGRRPRIGAVPLPWPVPHRPPLLLHAVAVAAWRSSERPVALRQGARLVFRGRTRTAQTVRFGFSTQRMQGVFAGKFETDVAPGRLVGAADGWEVSLPLSEFHPLSPDLSGSPAGLELTDVYALTVDVDAGLEVERIELLPGPPTSRDTLR